MSAGVLMCLLAAACEDGSNGGPALAPAAHGVEHAGDASLAKADGIEDLLPVVKRLTQPYQSISAAIAAGYSAQLTPCMENPPAGGMGFHYGNAALIDGVVQALKPEILMYEPQASGQLLLVGVEYVVPYTAWTKPTPPAIAGVRFHRNDAFGLWVLHAWIWKHNPSGTLSDWNSTVTCRYATNGQ
jgi:hypothetical protein